MLGKLLKYEFKATARTFLPLYAGLLIFAGVNKLFWSIGGDSTPAAISTMLYIFMIIAIFAFTIIIMIQRFHKNLLGDEGYLMFTLPAQSWKHIVCKLLTSLIWTVLSVAVTLLSVFLLALNTELLGKLFTELPRLFAEFHSFVGAEGYALMAEFIVMTLILLASGILMVYASIAVGHQFGNHRLLASFGAFLVFNIVLQIIQTIIITAFGAFTIGIPNDFDGQTLSHITMIGYSLLHLLFSAGYFILTNYLLTKRLNLE